MYMVKAPVIPDMVKMRMAVPNDDFKSGYFLTTDEIFPIPMPVSKSNAFLSPRTRNEHTPWA
jgi:hypothetical protein